MRQDQRFTPDYIKQYGFIPYAVYGGKVYSAKHEETGDRIYPDNVLIKILMTVQNGIANGN